MLVSNVSRHVYMPFTKNISFKVTVTKAGWKTITTATCCNNRLNIIIYAKIAHQTLIISFLVLFVAIMLLLLLYQYLSQMVSEDSSYQLGNTGNTYWT